MINVNVGGRLVPMMIDTGATCTCIQKKYAEDIPMLGSWVKHN